MTLGTYSAGPSIEQRRARLTDQAVTKIWLKLEHDDPKVVTSPLCKRAFKRDGLTVEVHIYRLEHRDKWTLEVVDRDDNSIVWDCEFDTDADAYEEFLRAVMTEGIDGILRNYDRLH